MLVNAFQKICQKKMLIIIRNEDSSCILMLVMHLGRIGFHLASNKVTTILHCISTVKMLVCGGGDMSIRLMMMIFIVDDDDHGGGDMIICLMKIILTQGSFSKS